MAEPAGRWGWRADPGSDGRRPIGERVGWVEGGEVYLDPDASYAAVQKFARDLGEPFQTTARTLHQRLNGGGLLASAERGRGKLKVRKVFQGSRRSVLHVRWPDGDSVPMGRLGRSAERREAPGREEKSPGRGPEWGSV